MRILHTSDWHLGRIFYGLHLTDDQAHVLDQLVALVRDARPDLVVVAGDVYDRAVPPPEAVALLDEVLCRIAVDLKTPILVIAGNHDSPDRIAFGSRLMSRSGVHLFGTLPELFEPLVLEDAHGPISFLGLPYAEPQVVRTRLGGDATRLGDAPAASIDSHDSAMRALLAAARAAHPPVGRSVLVAHAFVAGGQESESERPLVVGGSGIVHADCFSGFDYVALGHLHRPQDVGTAAVRYCGSLLKYSFSEAAHAKSVTLVEIDAAGTVRTEAVALSPRRDVRVVKGSLAEILGGPSAGQSKDDYILAELSDRGALLDPMGKLREVYPNCLHIGRSALFEETAGHSGTPRSDHRTRGVAELFGDFVRQVTGEPMSDAESGAFNEILDGMERLERESGV